MTQPLLPDLPGFSIEQVALEGGMITVLAHSQTTTAPCPVCNQVSSRVHGRYTRHLADLPWSGRTVRLKVQVRRFVCLRRTCSRKTFAEALPALAERHARRTTRLTDLLLHVGLALGGEAGARFTSVLSVPCSADTLLRTIRRTPLPPIESPRSIGIDDWAWRKGHRYGTIICDLERHHVIDLLPDRNASSVANWLKRYPSIEVISRDRSDIYAQGARLGAPQAVQVADKWHLLKNLGEVVQRLLAHHLTMSRKQQQALRTCQKTFLLEKRSPHISKQQEHVVQMHRESRLALYHQVLALHQQGMSHQAIATIVRIGHSTVSRWLAVGTFPERKRREQASQLDRYLPFLREQWDQGNHNMARLYREVVTKGYQGSYASVRAVMTSLGQADQSDHLPQTQTPVLVSSQQATWLFLRQPEGLTAKEQETVEMLCDLDAEVAFAYTLVQQFALMVRTRTGEHLDAWLEAVSTSSLTPLHSFVAGIFQDQAAVQAGLIRSESQGQTEGQVTRLKLIKRQGYGRAHFDLLRQRVLHAA